MRPMSARVEAVQMPIIPQVADWIRAHPGTLSLGQGVAGYGPPPEAWASLGRLKQDPLLHRYQPVVGFPELVEAMKLRLARRLGVEVGTERRLMVTAGANAAFQQVVLTICDPGDEVLLPLPWYFNQEMALTLANVRTVPVVGDSRHWPRLDSLKSALTPRTRAVVTVSPNNPTGAVYPPDLLRAINEFCRDHGLFHISDETYEAFVHGDTPHASPGAFPGSEQHTICLHSLSKAFGFASWRIGFVILPVALDAPFRAIQDTWLICPPVASQLAGLGCLQSPDSWLQSRLVELQAVRRQVLDGLQALDAGVQSSPADGAFYVYLELPAGMDSLAVTRLLIEEHRVAVLPGTAFGMPHQPSLRVAYGALSLETAGEGIGRLVHGLHQLRSDPRCRIKDFRPPRTNRA